MDVFEDSDQKVSICFSSDLKEAWDRMRITSTAKTYLPYFILLGLIQYIQLPSTTVYGSNLLLRTLSIAIPVFIPKTPIPRLCSVSFQHLSSVPLPSSLHLNRLLKLPNQQPLFLQILLNLLNRILAPMKLFEEKSAHKISHKIPKTHHVSSPPTLPPKGVKRKEMQKLTIPAPRAASVDVF